MPSPTYDLTTEPWIPVRWLSGRSSAVGLRELFLRAQEIADINVSLPPAASGLMRLLYVMAAEIAGLVDHDDHEGWLDERDRLLEVGHFGQQEVQEYFTASSRCFDLFSPVRPFLQDRRLADECVDSKGKPVSSGVNKLVWGRAAGNTQMWLSHDSDARPRPVPAEEAVLHLIAWLYYGPSGMSTPRMVNGRSAKNTTAGPLRSTISFHPIGANLFETLLLGTPFLKEGKGGSAPWEEQEMPDPLGVPPRPVGLTGVLAGRFRHALLLNPAADGRTVVDARITWAWREPQGAAEDPYLIYQRSKKGERYARRASADRAIWRDFDTLLRKTPGPSDERRPAIIDDLVELHDSDFYRSRVDRVRVRSFGFDQEGQARDRQFFSGTTPPVLTFLEEKRRDRCNYIGQARRDAEQVGGNLRTALMRAWRELVGSSEAKVPWLGIGEARYWSAAERKFWHLITAEDPPAYVRNEFIRLALAAYGAATDAYTHDPRHVAIIEKFRTHVLNGWQREEGEI